MSDEEPGEKKKVSIADALDQLRQGGPAPNVESAATKAAKQASAQKAQRIPPAFWLQNLQDSIQRRRDTLWDKLAEGGATEKAEMQRRDLISVESFYLPAEMISEVEPTKPSQQVGDVTRFQDIEILDLNATPDAQVEDNTVGAVAGPQFQSVGRFDGIESLDFKALVGMGGMEEVGRGQGGPEQPGTRFDGALDLDNPLLGLELEEVETEVVDNKPKKFKVNPMIRQMFQNMGNNENQGSE